MDTASEQPAFIGLVAQGYGDGGQTFNSGGGGMQTFNSGGGGMVARTSSASSNHYSGAQAMSYTANS